MQNFAGSDWHRLIPAVQYCDFRRRSLDTRIGSAMTLNNGFPVMTGKLGQGIYLGGQKYQTTNKANYLSFSRGTQISGNNYTNINTNQGTISFWIKPYWDSTDGKIHYILSNSTNDVIALYQNSSGNLVLILNGVTVCNTSASFVAGTWYHISIKWDCDVVVNTSKYAQVFVDNSEIASRASVMIALAPNNTLYLGSDRSFNYPLEAILDDFAIWDRVLTDAEITDLYNSGTGKVASTYADSHLKLYLPFDATAAYSGTAMGCSAGNMRTGNLQTDGDMETAGTANYITLAGATLSKVTSGQLFDTQCLRVQGVSDSDGARAAMTLTNGSTYHVELWYKVVTGTLVISYYDGTTTQTLKGSLTDSGWTKFETEIKATAIGFSILIRQQGATALDCYIDDLIVVANKIANGGLEGTYSGGIAPDFTDAGTGVKTEETSIVRTGSKSQKIVYTTSGNGITQSTMTGFSVDGWVIQSFHSYYTSNGPTLALYHVNQNIAIQAAHGVNAWGKTTKVTKTTQTSYSPYLTCSGTNTTIYHDDVFVFILSSVDITLNYLAQADLFENNGSNVGITLGGQYISIANQTVGNQGAILIALVPKFILSLDDISYIWIDASSVLRLYFNSSTNKFTFRLPDGTLIASSAFTTNALLQTRIRILISWDFVNNIYEMFINGIKVAGHYSSVTYSTLSATHYISRGTNGYGTPAQSNIEKLVIFNCPIAVHQAIGIDNAYEYSL